jgi:hypothetical protein
MKVYSSGKVEEFSPYGLLTYMLLSDLIFEKGSIFRAEILERKVLSNKGNALNCSVRVSPILASIINIGGNPVGSGWMNYMKFLEEAGCKKPLGLYNLDSLIGKDVYLLATESSINRTTRGVITQKGFNEIKFMIKGNDLEKFMVGNHQH